MHSLSILLTPGQEHTLVRARLTMASPGGHTNPSSPWPAQEVTPSQAHHGQPSTGHAKPGSPWPAQPSTGHTKPWGSSLPSKLPIQLGLPAWVGAWRPQGSPGAPGELAGHRGDQISSGRAPLAPQSACHCTGPSLLPSSSPPHPQAEQLDGSMEMQQLRVPVPPSPASPLLQTLQHHCTTQTSTSRCPSPQRGALGRGDDVFLPPPFFHAVLECQGNAKPP